MAWNILGVGSPLVDQLLNVDDAFLKEHVSGAKGGMEMVEPEVISAYYEKWGFAEGRPDNFSEEEQERVMRENPFDIDFRMKAVVNGKVQEKWSGSGMNWIPECCFFGDMENTEEATEEKTEE